MDINNKRGFVTGTSISELQNIESMYRNAKPLINGVMSKRKSTLRKLKKQLEVQHDRLEEALKKLGQDPNHYLLRETISNDFASLPESENIQTYINPNEAAYKEFYDASLNTFNRILDTSTKPIIREIRNIKERIKTIRRKIWETEKQQEQYNIAEGKTLEARNKNKESFDKLELSHSRLTAIFSQLLGLRKLFDVIPNSLAAEATIENFKENLDVISPEYVSKKLWLQVNLKEYIDDPNMVMKFIIGDTFVDSTGEEQKYLGIETILQDIESFPRQFVDAVSHKKDIVGVDTSVTSSSSTKTSKTSKKGTEVVDNTQKKDGKLTRDIRSMSVIIEESIVEISNVSGRANVVVGDKGETITNPELLSLKNKTLSILKSQVKSSVVVNFNRSEMLEINKKDMIEEEEKRDKLSFALERIASKFREGPQIVGSIFNEFGKDLVTRAIMNRGFPKKWEKKSEEAQKDNKREEVRKLYGGNVPFCDEVIINEDGKDIFILKEDAVQLKNGTYVRKSNEESKEFIDMYGRPDTDIYD